MNVVAFLLLIFFSLLLVGVILATLGYRKVYWALMAGIAALLMISLAATWRPSTDDPIPALMFLVIGVYGSLAGVAGMLAGLIISKLWNAGRRAT